MTMTFEELKEMDQTYVMQTYNRFPVDIDHGKNATLYSLSGKEYIDFTSGIGVCSLGCADPRWVQAITDQAGQQDVAMNGCFSGTTRRNSSASSTAHRSAPMATSSNEANPSCCMAALI